MSFIDTLNRFLGDPNERELKRIRPLAEEVLKMHRSPVIQALTRDDLPKKTEEFKSRIAASTPANDLLVEAFAVVIRACELLQGEKLQIGRQEFVWDMVPFPVQVIGGIVLHQGRIAEMKTGEGKTLVCTLPVYLNALAGKGVHVVTVNDYLARRDSGWMGILYKVLGLTVGCVVHGLSTEGRYRAYASDVTYGTNNEFGFDYLRDNMASSLTSQVQRSLHYAIVDEVDSILIDEARTPLIISQPAEESTTKYTQHAALVRQLQENVHYNKDEKQKTAVLTEEGVKKMEQLLGLENIYTERGFEEVHHIEQALRAHAIYQRDVDYVVKEGEVIIVDEFTGRLMPGRRYSHGLHQAIEAKERVAVQRESRTLATITFQNYFRLYKKLAGMTGTAKTEEEEFESIYRLRTIVIPTNKSMVRSDEPDAIYRTVAAKFKAVAAMAKEKHATGQPLLIGTTSIEKSEVLSKLLEQETISHNVLNAKNHEREAEIIAKAGQPGAVTIATNMAGRGTDIKLGLGVRELGGLCILGTERHEARRIDNQLRGRSGRQGDPGESRFFVSMEDDLMRLFGGERLKGMMERLQVPDDVPLQNAMVSRSIEGAQKRVEGHNFDIRRHVLHYDDVMNKHREIIYKRRQKILEKLEEASSTDESVRESTASSLHEDVLRSLKREGHIIVESHAPSDDPENWNVKEMRETIAALHPALVSRLTGECIRSFAGREPLAAHIAGLLMSFYEEKCAAANPVTATQAEKVVTLRSIDTHWMDHIDDMAHLREQVAFAGFAQRDPLVEYQDQGFRRFRQLLANIESAIVRMLLQIDFAQFAPQLILAQAEEELEHLQTNEEQIESEGSQTGVSADTGEIKKIAAGPRHPSVSPISHSHQPPATSHKPQAVTSRGGGSPAPDADPGQNVPFDSASLRLGYPSPDATAERPRFSRRVNIKVGRNDPCPCGSGKKFKKCHGKDS